MKSKITPPVEILPLETVEVMPDAEIPAKEIVISQIIEKDGKRYETRNAPGCISRICIDEPETLIEPVEPTLEERVKVLEILAGIKE